MGKSWNQWKVLGGEVESRGDLEGRSSCTYSSLKVWSFLKDFYYTLDLWWKWWHINTLWLKRWYVTYPKRHILPFSRCQRRGAWQHISGCQLLDPEDTMTTNELMKEDGHAGPGLGQQRSRSQWDNPGWVCKWGPDCLVRGHNRHLGSPSHITHRLQVLCDSSPTLHFPMRMAAWNHTLPPSFLHLLHPLTSMPALHSFPGSTTRFTPITLTVTFLQALAVDDIFCPNIHREAKFQ